MRIQRESEHWDFITLLSPDDARSAAKAPLNGDTREKWVHCKVDLSINLKKNRDNISVGPYVSIKSEHFR